MTAISGTRRAAPATSRREAWRTRPVASASGPTMIPGVSTRETTGRPKASQSWRNRAALSAPSLVIAPAMWRVSLAMKPSGRPSIAGERRDHLRREALAQEDRRALVGDRLDDRRDGVGAPLALGDELAKAPLVGLGARGAVAPWKKASSFFVTAVASASSATATSTTPFAVCISIGPISSASTTPSPPPSIIAGPPIPSEMFSVATIRSAQPAITALPAKQRPATTAIRGTSPESPAQSANARTSRAETTG